MTTYMYLKRVVLSLALCATAVTLAEKSSAKPQVQTKAAHQFVLKHPNNYPELKWKRVRALNAFTIAAYKKALTAYESQQQASAKKPELIWES